MSVYDMKYILTLYLHIVTRAMNVPVLPDHPATSKISEHKSLYKSRKEHVSQLYRAIQSSVSQYYTVKYFWPGFPLLGEALSF